MNVKRFLIKLSVFVILLIITDIVVTKIMQIAYFNTPAGEIHKNDYLLNHSKEDIVVFGASGATHHYDPRIFEDTLGMTCFNAGCDGTGFNFGYPSFIYMLNRYTPKVIILDMARPEYGEYVNSNVIRRDPLPMLAPFYGNVAKFDSLLTNDWRDKVKMLSGMYRYNSKIGSMLSGYFMPYEESGGYFPLDKVLKQQERKVVNDDFKFIDDKFNQIINFVNIAREKGCIVVFAASPYYAIDTTDVYAPINDVFNQEGVYKLDYRQDPYFMSSHEFFADMPAHLNGNAAEEYSRRVASDIKRILKK
ncbi:MAG: hypothetical protein RR257_04220 [Rikenellaceae bacterium]